MTETNTETTATRPYSEITVWRAAQLVIAEYGHEAQSAAAMCAEMRRRKRDLAGERVWLRVMMAVRELQRSDRRQEEHLN
ncbi:MAG TPA: hypothetical protein VL966_00190 [Alphaproteobacteria bacterium]|jgi:hypothetical protein|nr:hypothetical protein [Alphaproteobacteria bacterium]